MHAHADHRGTRWLIMQILPERLGTPSEASDMTDSATTDGLLGEGFAYFHWACFMWPVSSQLNPYLVMPFWREWRRGSHV
jgi:hypothetical protein